MSSFYGPGWGGGADGSTDYDKLKNVPVMNLTGTEQAPVYLPTLEYGNYNIKGSYRWGQKETLVGEFEEDHFIRVIKDEVTHKKVIMYDTVIDGELTMVTITYEDDGTAIREEQGLSEAHLQWKTF